MNELYSAVLLSLVVSTVQQCAQQLEWTTNGVQVLVNGQPFVLKGVNYFGFETNTYVVHGIWQGSNKDLNFFLDFIQSNNFNAIRVPLSMELIRNNPGNIDVQCDVNPELCGKNALEILDIFIDRAAERGLLIMLDNHQITGSSGITELWYNSDYSEADVISLWQQLVTRYQDRWNVFAIDLKNEPHDSATWGNSNSATDWNKAAERMITALSDFKGLYFVEGIEWGGRMEAAAQFPISTGNASLDNRVIYSAHCYGPSVTDRPEFHDANYPNNLDAIYMGKYGFVPPTLNKPLIIGEWGGRAEEGTSDYTWNSWYASWLGSKCYSNNFYWCLNPNSGDTGGLLEDDWTTPIPRKLALAAQAQPNPTKFNASNGQICITPGSYPVASCNNGVTSPPGVTTKSTAAPVTTSSTAKATTSSPKATAAPSPVTQPPSPPAPSTVPSAGSGVTIQVNTVNSWVENGRTNGQYALVITNNSSSKVCGVTIALNVVPSNKWNLNDAANGEFALPSYITLEVGASTDQPGFIAMGTATANVVSVQNC